MFMIKRFGYFFGLCAYALGSLGGFGCAMYIKSYAVAAAVAVLAAMAFPTAGRFFKKLTE